MDLDPDPSINKLFLLLFDFLSLKTDVNVTSKIKKQKNFEKKLIFCYHLVRH